MNHLLQIQQLLGVLPPWIPEWDTPYSKMRGWAPKYPKNTPAEAQWQAEYGVAKYDPLDGQPWCTSCGDLASDARDLYHHPFETNAWYCQECFTGDYDDDTDD